MIAKLGSYFTSRMPTTRLISTSVGRIEYSV
jgi:hypothetical protein